MKTKDSQPLSPLPCPSVFSVVPNPHPPSPAHHFSHENISFDYLLIRTPRKTLAATVLPSQSVIVKVPPDATTQRINDFLRRKIRWILRQKRYFAQFKPQFAKRYVSGESHKYRGRTYKLLIRKNAQQERVSLQHGTLTVYSPHTRQPSHARQQLDAWYREKAHIVFQQRLEACCKLFDYKEIPGLMIRPMKRRWGSYSRKTNHIILNQELIKAATRHIDYVIIHELCHVTYPNHSRAFDKLLSRKCPQWQLRKAELEHALLS